MARRAAGCLSFLQNWMPGSWDWEERTPVITGLEACRIENVSDMLFGESITHSAWCRECSKENKVNREYINMLIS